jgi:hypothetical protein
MILELEADKASVRSRGSFHGSFSDAPPAYELIGSFQLPADTEGQQFIDRNAAEAVRGC